MRRYLHRGRVASGGAGGRGQGGVFPVPTRAGDGADVLVLRLLIINSLFYQAGRTLDNTRGVSGVVRQHLECIHGFHKWMDMDLEVVQAPLYHSLLSGVAGLWRDRTHARRRFCGGNILYRGVGDELV